MELERKKEMSILLSYHVIRHGEVRCWIAKPEPHELEFQKKKNHMNWGAGGINVRIEWKVRCVIYLIFVVVGYYNVLLQ